MFQALLGEYRADRNGSAHLNTSKFIFYFIGKF